jgi:anti-anti-sigma regulatory factor
LWGRDRYDMLKLDVVDTGIVAFQMPARVARADAEDLDQALRLLADGGCRAAIINITALAHMSGDALVQFAQSSMRTRKSPMALVFVADGNAAARNILHNAIFEKFDVYKTVNEAAYALHAELHATGKLKAARGASA